MKIQRAIVNGSLFLKKAGLGSRIIVLKFTLTPRLYRFLLSKKTKNARVGSKERARSIVLAYS